MKKVIGMMENQLKEEIRAAITIADEYKRGTLVGGADSVVTRMKMHLDLYTELQEAISVLEDPYG